MEYLIEKIDNQGRGITFINGKIAFIKNALPGDTVTVKINTEKSKFITGNVEKYIKKSEKRVESICPYSGKCGGCQFMCLNYEDSFDLKIDSYKNFLVKNKINIEPVFIKNPSPLNYRNKLSLKLKDGVVGFYEENSNKIVPINACKVASQAINNFISIVKDINIKNGFITVRSNYKDELLINITTKDKINLENVDAAGIILNNSLVKGEKFFVDKINDLLFEISYDSFFQVNPFVTEKLFNIIDENINEENVVLDLYCGVGTLGLCASKKTKKVYGLEVVKNAVINANNNALINKIENAEFKVADLSKNIKVKNEFDTLIVDPPRSGIDKVVMNFIYDNLPEKIIYVSCDYHTLVRDLNVLSENYNIKKLYTLDMFSYSYHLESTCILERR